MKKTLGCLFISLICSNKQLTAQTISMSADSVKLLLCNEWEMNYILLGSTKVSASPAQQLYFNFKPDNTFLSYDNHSSSKAKGTWAFDPKKKLILLMINGKHDYITSLREGELVQRVETEKGTQEIKMVYKIKVN